MTKDRASIIAKLAAGLSDADRNCGAATRPSSPPPTSWSASDLVEGGGGGAPAGALPRDLRSWAFDDHESTAAIQRWALLQRPAAHAHERQRRRRAPRLRLGPQHRDARGVPRRYPRCARRVETVENLHVVTQDWAERHAHELPSAHAPEFLCSNKIEHVDAAARAAAAAEPPGSPAAAAATAAAAAADAAAAAVRVQHDHRPSASWVSSPTVARARHRLWRLPVPELFGCQRAQDGLDDTRGLLALAVARCFHFWTARAAAAFNRLRGAGGGGHHGRCVARRRAAHCIYCGARGQRCSRGVASTSDALHREDAPPLGAPAARREERLLRLWHSRIAVQHGASRRHWIFRTVQGRRDQRRREQGRDVYGGVRRAVHELLCGAHRGSAPRVKSGKFLYALRPAMSLERYRKQEPGALTVGALSTARSFRRWARRSSETA